jgi:hypothetical protein
MDVVHVHHLTKAGNKRARIIPPPTLKPKRKRQSRPTDKGEISFSSIRAKRSTSAGTKNQDNVNPPPLPLSNSEFLLHTPRRPRNLDISNRSLVTPSQSIQFLSDSDADGSSNRNVSNGSTINTNNKLSTPT